MRCWYHTGLLLRTMASARSASCTTPWCQSTSVKRPRRLIPKHFAAATQGCQRCGCERKGATLDVVTLDAALCRGVMHALLTKHVACSPTLRPTRCVLLPSPCSAGQGMVAFRTLRPLPLSVHAHATIPLYCEVGWWCWWGGGKARVLNACPKLYLPTCHPPPQTMFGISLHVLELGRAAVWGKVLNAYPEINLPTLPLHHAACPAFTSCCCTPMPPLCVVLQHAAGSCMTVLDQLTYTAPLPCPVMHCRYIRALPTSRHCTLMPVLLCAPVLAQLWLMSSPSVAVASLKTPGK
jgi:hypothetical protein